MLSTLPHILWVLVLGAQPSAPAGATPATRGTSIIAAGQPFDVGRPVVLWNDEQGFDGYQTPFIVLTCMHIPAYMNIIYPMGVDVNTPEIKNPAVAAGRGAGHF